MLVVKDLVKQYGQKVVLKSVSFSLPRHSAIGFIGPNGAGKSTTMNLITGYLQPTAGSISLDGIDLGENPILYKKRIGYLPETPPLYFDMTVKEYIHFVCSIKAIPTAEIHGEGMRVMELAKVNHVSQKLIRNLSKGYKQRVGLAQALIGNPDFIILDEPTIGLDPIQIVEFRNLLLDLKKTHTILLSSHILSEIQEICDEVIMICNGKLIEQGTMEQILAPSTNSDHLSTEKQMLEAIYLRKIAEAMSSDEETV